MGKLDPEKQYIVCQFLFFVCLVLAIQNVEQGFLRMLLRMLPTISVFVVSLYWYMRFRKTRLYHMIHCTNREFWDELVLFLGKQNIEQVSGKGDWGYYLIAEIHQLRVLIYLPFNRGWNNRSRNLRRYLEDIIIQKEKFDVDCAVLIINGEVGCGLGRGFKWKPYRQHKIDIVNRRDLSRMLCKKEEVLHGGKR